MRWNSGQVLSLRLRDGLYALAQMYVSPYMQFYNVFSSSNDWPELDLALQERLFCVAVSDKRMKPLMPGLVGSAIVSPDTRDMPREMIDAHLNFEGGHPFRGGDLILLDESGESVGAPVIQSNLEVGHDDGVIQGHELTNMWVEPDKLRDRLIRFYESGIDWDVHKELVFPGVELPKSRAVVSLP